MSNKLQKIYAYTIATKKILLYALVKNKVTEVPGTTAHEIVRTIVNSRTQNEYIYTGGHYTDFYIRNIGTFANKLLDPLSNKTEAEYQAQRNLIYKSLSLALTVFSEHQQITTTIVKAGTTYIPINIYVQPSDSLPSLLKGLYQLQAATLIESYGSFLQSEIEKFTTSLTDSSGLIRPDIALSGIKDAWIRKSSFYDNIMLFSVYDYADELNLNHTAKGKKDELKNKLLNTYWNNDHGIFYDESPGNYQPYFSADTLIAYEMDFLNPHIHQERMYLEQIVHYIQQHQLDQPFPLKATEKRIPSKEHLPVRLFAPNYIGTTIWSYWGMVYINLLIDLGQLKQARQHLHSYEQNILDYHGFPELYTPDGKLYQTPFYRSVNDMIWGIYYLYLENKLTAAEQSATAPKDAR